MPKTKTSTLRQEIIKLKKQVAKLITSDAKLHKRFAKKNPMKHFPPLPGRGRPEKVREIEMTTIMGDGRAAQKTLIATKSKAYAQARRVLAKGIQGRPVRQILVEDKKVIRGKKARKSAKR